MKLRSTTVIREELDTLLARARAILAAAEQEGRDLTPEEVAELEQITGVGEPGSPNYRPGAIDALREELGQRQRVEAKVRDLADLQQSLSRHLPAQMAQPSALQTSPRIGRDEPPRELRPSALLYRQLRAFRGPTAERDAYLSGQWFLATFFGHERAQQWCRDHGVETRFRAAISTSDSSMGYLVPEELERAIVALREEAGVARRFATVLPMTSDTLRVPYRDVGATAYWVGEGSAITASDPTVRGPLLTARKLASLVVMSSELAEDAVISLADYLAEEFAWNFARAEDDAAFNGDGSATYGNITGLKNALANGSWVTAATGRLSFGALTMSEFEAMVAKTPLYALADARWYISRAGWASSMLRLLDAAGGNTNATLAAGTEPMFLGYPVTFVQVMNSNLANQASTKGLVYFGSLRYALVMGARRSISLAISTERYFESDQIGVKGTERVGIVVADPGTASVPGSLVGLQTPAT